MSKKTKGSGWICTEYTLQCWSRQGSSHTAITVPNLLRLLLWSSCFAVGLPFTLPLSMEDRCLPPPHGHPVRTSLPGPATQTCCGSTWVPIFFLADGCCLHSMLSILYCRATTTYIVYAKTVDYWYTVLFLPDQYGHAAKRRSTFERI